MKIGESDISESLWYGPEFIVNKTLKKQDLQAGES